MKKYTYYFNDGTKSVVEVSDELYDLLKELDKEEYNNNHKNTRRHSSLEMLLGKGVEFEKIENKTAVDMEFEFLTQLDNEVLIEAIGSLTLSQQNLVYLRYFLRVKQCDIAKQYGMKPAAITRQLKRILEKIKNSLNKM